MTLTVAGFKKYVNSLPKDNTTMEIHPFGLLLTNGLIQKFISNELEDFADFTTSSPTRVSFLDLSNSLKKSDKESTLSFDFTKEGIMIERLPSGLQFQHPLRRLASVDEVIMPQLPEGATVLEEFHRLAKKAVKWGSRASHFYFHPSGVAWANVADSIYMLPCSVPRSFSLSLEILGFIAKESPEVDWLLTPTHLVGLYLDGSLAQISVPTPTIPLTLPWFADSLLELAHTSSHPLPDGLFKVLVQKFPKTIVTIKEGIARVNDQVLDIEDPQISFQIYTEQLNLLTKTFPKSSWSVYTEPGVLVLSSTEGTLIKVSK